MHFRWHNSTDMTDSSTNQSQPQSEPTQMSTAANTITRPSDKTSTWNVDSTHANASFAVRHLMISTVRGRFGTVSGTVTVDEDHPQDSKIAITIDVTTI